MGPARGKSTPLAKPQQFDPAKRLHRGLYKRPLSTPMAIPSSSRNHSVFFRFSEHQKFLSISVLNFLFTRSFEPIFFFIQK